MNGASEKDIKQSRQQAETRSGSETWRDSERMGEGDKEKWISEEERE